MRKPAPISLLKRFAPGLVALGVASIPGFASSQSIGPTGEVMTPSTASSATNSAAGSRSTGMNPFSPSAGLGGMAGNPLANPYLNPYLNPMMTNQTMTPQNAALYFLAAQQAAGGIGSGRLSGSRGDNTKGVVAAGPPARGGSNQPGAGASQFFGRGVARGAGASHFFKRQGRHFPGNSK